MFGDEQGCNAIAVSGIEPHPLRHHTQHPCVKPLAPRGHINGHAVGQVAYVVVPVPTPAHTVEVIANGIVGLHHIRLGVSPDVLVPHIDAVQTGLDGNGVAHTLVCRQEVGLRSQRTEFGISLHRVVAHLIVAPQIVNQTAGDVVSDTFWGVFVQWFSLIEFYDFSLGLNIFFSFSYSVF